ncbi:MAG: hypothetical protein U0325_32485 [Polyangiales bacterium]
MLIWQLRLTPTGRITSATLLPAAGPPALRTSVALCVRNVLLNTPFNALAQGEVTCLQSFTFAPR